MAESALLAPVEARTRTAKIDLHTVLSDFLNTHAKAERSYVLPDHDAVLRQATLPEDARLVWARLDEDDEPRKAALRSAVEHLRGLAGQPFPTADEVAAIRARAVHDGEVGTVTLTSADAMLLFRAALAADSCRLSAVSCQLLEAAINRAPARHLVVGIQSEAFALAPQGAEPEMEFDHAAFRPEPEATEATALGKPTAASGQQSATGV